MILSRLELNNFRNYPHREFVFSDGVNVIRGANGTGKTNILEAIHMLATSKSHRMAREREIILHGQAFSRIRAEFSARGRVNELEARLGPDRRKQFSKNHVPVRKTSDLIGFLSVVMFSPDDLQIIKGSPQARRKTIDLSLCQMSKRYFQLLSNCNRVLVQKNKLLKSDAAADALEVWDMQLARFGTEISRLRAEYIQILSEEARGRFSELMGLKLGLTYTCGAGEGVADEDAYYDEIVRNADKERKYRQSLVGPHRDDFHITISERSARAYASQGQQRSAVIALKMGQVEILRSRLEEPPLLLLDDVMSELDSARQKYILSSANDGQVIITTANKAPAIPQAGCNEIDVES
ncbi:MAG: DNA replication/repair protein RecF [Clostridiales bacterium]|jgi:DNA replication and repair protein RecF|nr:DNA replication/repair protein RecF [Clostridiales bacterium]